MSFCPIRLIHLFIYFLMLYLFLTNNFWSLSFYLFKKKIYNYKKKKKKKQFPFESFLCFEKYCTINDLVIQSLVLKKGLSFWGMNLFGNKQDKMNIFITAKVKTTFRHFNFRLLCIVKNTNLYWFHLFN